MTPRPESPREVIRVASEWPETLDIRALLEWGWRPTPFNEFILKVHSRCNLSCDYCYIYEMADQRWRSQPRRMSRPIVRRAADRIAEHARANGLNRVSVTLHGGEPLLAGVDHLRYVLETVQKTTAPDVVVNFHVQTNGTLLNSPFLDLFDEFNVRVGVSIDGGEAAHDLHRRRADGRGSYEEVRTGLRRMTTPGSCLGPEASHSRHQYGRFAQGGQVGQRRAYSMSTLSRNRSMRESTRIHALMSASLRSQET